MSGRKLKCALSGMKRLFRSARSAARSAWRALAGVARSRIQRRVSRQGRPHYQARQTHQPFAPIRNHRRNHIPSVVAVEHSKKQPWHPWQQQLCNAAAQRRRAEAGGQAPVRRRCRLLPRRWDNPRDARREIRPQIRPQNRPQNRPKIRRLAASRMASRPLGGTPPSRRAAEAPPPAAPAREGLLRRRRGFPEARARAGCSKQPRTSFRTT